MKGDEYKEAIADMTKFMMNKWMPRSLRTFKGCQAGFQKQHVVWSYGFSGGVFRPGGYINA